MDAVKQQRPRLINWPNAITFFRYGLVFSIWNLKREYKYMILSIIVYTISCLLDIFDGYISRKCRQRTVVGALLDQIVDRATTMTSCIDAIMVFPEYKIPIYIWMVVDIFGHWIYFYSCCYVGTINHKFINCRHKALNLYYKYKPLMFLTIVCTETFWVSAYWYKTMPLNLSYIAVNVMMGVAPLALFRTIACIYQIFYGLNAALDHERKLYDKSK